MLTDINDIDDNQEKRDETYVMQEMNCIYKS